MKSKKQQEIEQRSIKHGLLFIERNHTVRSIAKKTGYCKTTVHLDLLRLENIRPELFSKVNEKLQFNKSTRHYRGGEATRKKYKKGE